MEINEQAPKGVTGSRRMKIMTLALCLWAGTEITCQALNVGGMSGNAYMALVTMLGMYLGFDMGSKLKNGTS